MQICRVQNPDFVPYRLKNGAFRMHTRVTAKPIKRMSNTVQVFEFAEMIAKLKTGRYYLRMYIPGRGSPSLIAPWRICIDGQVAYSRNAA